MHHSPVIRWVPQLLEGKLDEAKANKAQLIARAKSAQTQKKVAAPRDEKHVTVNFEPDKVRLHFKI